MTVYYVDPSKTGGDNDGGGDGTDRTDPTDSANWTHAWTSIQSAFDNVSTAGDIVYCNGTESPSVQIDVDTNSGTAQSYIRFIGCNGTSGVDGTRYVLDFGANTCHGIRSNGQDYITLENFEVKSTATGTYYGISSNVSSSADWKLINCYVHGWGSHGVDDVQMTGWVAFRSRFSNCTGDGAQGIVAVFCTFDNNTYGLYNAGGSPIGCVFRDNTYGLHCSGGEIIMNNVFYNNSNDNIVSFGTLAYIGNRFIDTGAYHIDNGATAFVYGNYFDNSGTGDLDGTKIDLNLDGATSDGGNHYSGGDTDDGFEDPANDDYNLRSDATNRSIPITLQ